ncbi:hypothetical protein Btru_033519 [Bulinus truncatus]|nr:hypothetical protein Btru_033519 [Bulinus truncatus]
MFTSVNSRTVDVRCENIEFINRVILEGEGITSLCSVYISAGRNVAMKQPTEQTSTNDTYYAWTAVDGNTSTAAPYGSCTLTNTTDMSPTWTLTFNGPVIVNSFEIYSRVDSPMRQYFTNSRLQTLDKNNAIVVNNTMPYTPYTSTNINPTPIQKIKITATNFTYPDAILSLCEVMAFGECPVDKWGVNCMEDCSETCQYKYCNNINGLCTAGCNGYSDPPYCTKACTKGYYGTNCGRRCPAGCPSEECDKTNGTCLLACRPNYQGPFCDEMEVKYDADCGMMWKRRPGTDLCYQFRETKMPWFQALEHCTYYKGSLASITSSEEQKYIEGQPRFENIPNCVGISADSMGWKDYRVTLATHFYLQKKKETNTMEKNLNLVRSLKPGDVVKIPTDHHVHWGVYVGDSMIIHISETKNCNLQGMPNTIVVTKESLLSVAKGNEAYRDFADLRPLPRHSIVARAKSKVGCLPYEEMFKSCEHFIFWCRYGMLLTQRDEKAHGVAASENDRKSIIMCNNFNVINNLEPGDIVKIHRNMFSHWGIYVGDNRLVNVQGNQTGQWTVSGVQLLPHINRPGVTEVVEESFLDVVKGDMAEIYNHSDASKRPFPSHEVVSRAKSKLGLIQYHPLYKNCEHFVNWCRYNSEESSQTQNVFAGVTLGSALGGFLLGGPIGAIATASFSAYQMYKHAQQNKPDENKSESKRF